MQSDKWLCLLIALIKANSENDWSKRWLTNCLAFDWMDHIKTLCGWLTHYMIAAADWGGRTEAWLGQLMTGDHHHQLNELSSPCCLRGPSVEQFMRYQLRPFASTALLKPLMYITLLGLYLNSSVCHFQIFVWVLIVSFISQSYILHPNPHMISCRSCELPVQLTWCSCAVSMNYWTLLQN